MFSSFKSPLWGKGSVEVGPEATQGESRVRRLAKTADTLITQPVDGIHTVYDVLAYAARTHGTRKAFGYRDIVKMVEEEKEVKKMVDGKEVTEKKTWKYFQLSDYKYYSFVEVKEIVSEVARGLLELELQKDDVLNIYAATGPNWQFVCYGCASIATTVATAYDTLGESGLQHSLNEPECPAVFTNAELLPVLAKVAANVPSLRLVIYDGEAKESVISSLKAVREGFQVLSLDELRTLGRGKPADLAESRLPSKDDVACIMYTSGTTGPPKGVVIKHSNLIAAIGSVYTLFGRHLQVDDTYLAFLPLAHILEYVVELCFLFIGMTSGYARVKTLTDTSVRNCVGDIKAFRPTIMIGVPAVWELIRKGILSQINNAGALKKSLFNGALSIKRANVPGLNSIVDQVVFSQIKAATGGKLRLALSGGAALSRETQEFLSLALVMLLQGYGMTETCGMCAILPPEVMQYGSVGLPAPSVEIKLLDVPDAGYKATNNPPQGEVCIRGPSVTSGYYKRDDLNTDETIFTSDGFLRTGDVGQWNKDGTLTLIDRIKNLVKLQGGEYIAIERLESIYKSCTYISNICVHATTEAKQPIAIIIPHEGHLRQGLESVSGVDAKADFATLCSHAKVQELVLKDCNAAGKKNGFKPMELLQGVILTADEWTPESGLVTAAQKLQRKKVAEKYDKEIKEAYKGGKD
ncbi:expressed putative fatty acid biosynthesis enzyme [Heterobasidion irregulare TC 32-1]|uniref:Expressed putative fatty acid biosynthesis enzyme n=1 Tax=Heterobasidion irregulare (strain TC 32-1) TaxID=747525 RepID=W4K2L3_HETIT|nr:expressed putative fatty acid biosynthesis enzyme [Heterobasidion irregulare TC 32-1]ETW80068.1 expressed putative fatty acid biosynthesis enzyme [Heterobasidion irregulare TC 32-1]